MFDHIFRANWRELPEEEARKVAREMVGRALHDEDRETTAQYSPDGEVQITSWRESRLFEVLGVLRQLDPALADRLVAEHSQLRAAAKRYPDGMDSVVEEGRRRAAEMAKSGDSCRGYVMAGDPADFPAIRAVMQGSQDGDFGPAMALALERYREEMEDGNAAPCEFWTSTSQFRSILYRAGQKLGPSASALLEQVPDADVRLLAQIELAAALAGLPEIGTVTRSHRRRDGGRKY